MNFQSESGFYFFSALGLRAPSSSNKQGYSHPSPTGRGKPRSARRGGGALNYSLKALVLASETKGFTA